MSKIDVNLCLWTTTKFYNGNSICALTLNWHSKKISLSKIFKFKKQIQINSNVPIILSGEQQRIKILIFEIKGYLHGRERKSFKATI